MEFTAFLQDVTQNEEGQQGVSLRFQLEVLKWQSVLFIAVHTTSLFYENY